MREYGLKPIPGLRSDTIRSAIPSTAILLPAHFFFPYCRRMQLLPTHLSISLTQVRSFSRSHYWFLESDCSGRSRMNSDVI